MARDRPRYVEAYPSDSKKTIGMLLEDMHVVIYGGGRRSEGQLPVTTGADVGNAAAFMASDRAGATTGTVFDLSSGTVVD